MDFLLEVGVVGESFSILSDFLVGVDDDCGCLDDRRKLDVSEFVDPDADGLLLPM